MLEINQLKLEFGDRTLFADVTLQLFQGQRYGLVGANGTGKSTLLRVLTGKTREYQGEVSWPKTAKLGYLEQDHFAFEKQRIIDVVVQGNQPLWEARQTQDRLVGKHDMDLAEAQMYAEAEDTILQNDGYSAESDAARLLDGLGIPISQHELLLNTLSGGFKLRVLMAQMLFGKPDILLLDEPTNHLDIYSIKWLETYLLEYPGLLLVISHDHSFLNGICSKILDIDYGTIREYTGNYDAFVAAKALEKEQIEKSIVNQDKKKAELMEFINRFKAKASKAASAQSRVKQLEKMDDIKLIPSSRQYPHFSFVPSGQSGRTTLKVDNLSKTFGDKRVLHNLSFELERGDRMAIIGPNGVGKSTLLKIIMDKLALDQGEFEWGHEAKPGYFAQDYHDDLQGDITCFDWLYSFDMTSLIGQIRNLLGRMLFSGDDVYNKLSSLSGGEATRLIFARMMLLPSNVLILDEPTNHLDLEAIEMLTEALATYKGTLLLVSHNRFLVHQVATRILELKPEGAVDFKGTYADYLEKHDTDHLSRDVSLKERTSLKSQETEGKAAASQAAGGPKKASQPALTGKDAYKAQKALRRKIQQLEKAYEKLEAEFSASNDDDLANALMAAEKELQQAQADLEAIL